MLLVIRVPIAWAIGTARFSAWPVALVLVGLVVPGLLTQRGLFGRQPLARQRAPAWPLPGRGPDL